MMTNNPVWNRRILYSVVILWDISIFMLWAGSGTVWRIGLVGSIAGLIAIICFIIYFYKSAKEDEGKQWWERKLLEKELKQYATFSKGKLDVTKRTPRFSEAFCISNVMHTPMAYNPVKYIYTSATVGGITTGGVDKVGGDYVSGKKVDSGKCELHYFGEKVERIQLTDDLYEKARNSVIEKYLDDSKQIVIERNPNMGAVLLSAEVTGIGSLVTQDLLHGGYPSEQKCREIIDWICEVE